MANVAAERGEYVRAMDLYAQTLLECRKLGDKSLEGSVLWHRADAFLQKGDLGAAHRAFGEGLEILERQGNTRYVATALSGLGQVRREMGDVASLALAKRLEQARPECVIVMGGANCEGPMGAETARQFPFVDAVVSGEGDLVFPDLVTRALDGRPLEGLPGVFTSTNAQVALAAGARLTAPMVQDMDALPIPDFSDYFEQFGRSRHAEEWQPSLFFESSRGCWWGERMHCTFCGLNGRTMSYRSKSAARAVAELTQLVERHPGCDIQVTDNILDLAYFKDFVPLLAERKLGVDLFYETKANLRKDQIRLLKRAGIRSCSQASRA